MFHQKYIVKQNVFVEVIVAVGESKRAVRSAEFHWHKFELGK